MDVANLIVAFLGVCANVAIAYAAFRAIRESQRTTVAQGEQFNKQYLQSQEENRARIRPYLRPDLPKASPRLPEFNDPSFSFVLINEGFGPAFNISVVFFPPGPAKAGEGLDPRRFGRFQIPAIGASNETLTGVNEGVTSLPGSTVLNQRTPFTLYAPSDGESYDEGIAPAIARATLTYRDVEGAKHGAIFDLITVPAWSWRLVSYLPNIEQTLDELNALHTALLLGKRPVEQVTAPKPNAE